MLNLLNKVTRMAAKKRRQKPKLDEAIRLIYQLFEPLLDKPDPDDLVLWINASIVHEKLGGMYAKLTLTRARVALGIKVIRAAGYSRWCLPQRTPEKALQSIHDSRLRSLGSPDIRETRYMVKYKREALQLFQRLMTDSHLDVPSETILRYLRENGFSRVTAHRMKKELGVESVKRPDGWYWVWASPEVKEWLEKRLSAGPVSLTMIQKEAEAMGWSPDVILAAKRELREVKDRITDNQLYWYDMNNTSVEGVR
jgi:hypothetical protein